MSRFVLQNEEEFEKAAALFRSFGVDPRGLSLADLRVRRRIIALHNHPDNGGDAETMVEINAAFDVLKKYCLEAREGYAPVPHPVTQDPSAGPPWANLGDVGRFAGGTPKILRNDYRDINYLRKTLWEKAGALAEPYVVHAFNGHDFEGAVLTYGSPAIFGEMGRAVAFWTNQGPVPGRAVAVFVAKLGHNDVLTLAFMDGNVTPPHNFHLDGRRLSDPVVIDDVITFLTRERGAPLPCSGQRTERVVSDRS